jgi:gliding motility-associated-like protein
VCENSSLKLEVFNPINTYTYTWIINNVIDSFGSTVNLDPITLLNSGTYSVNVIDENGCRNSAIGNITIKTCILFVPEMFTPNFDGKNDAFVISGLENYPNNNLSIYNRWGNKVYYKEKYDNEFKGFPNVGNTLSKDKLPVGTYYVIIDFGDKKMKNYSGILQLQY